MKKLAFHRCLRLVPTMTSAQRHDLKVAIEWRDKKDLVAAVVSLVGTPHHMSPLPPPRDSAVGKRFFLLHARRRDSGSLPTGQIVVDKTCSTTIYTSPRCHGTHCTITLHPCAGNDSPKTVRHFANAAGN